MNYLIKRLFVLTLLLPSTSFGQAPNSTESDDLREQVRIAWRLNQESLRAVQVEATETNLNSKVTEPVTETHKLPNGGVITLTHRPKTVNKLTFTFFEEQMLFEKSNADTGRKFLHLYDGSMWTEYRPENRTAIIRVPGQLAGTKPFDLRESFMLDVNESFESVLHKMVFTRNLDSGKASNLVVGSTNDQRFTIEFDPDLALLPVRSVYYYDNGEKCSENRLKYNLVQARNAFVPAKVISEYFDRGGVAVPNLVSTTVVDMVQPVELEAATLRFELPVGTRVVNLSDRN